MASPLFYSHDAFISYSRRNQEWIRTSFLPQLESWGFSVIVDYRDFEIGVPILTNIEHAIDGSRHTLIVLSPDWVDSEWGDFESLLAGTADPAGRRRKILPIMYEQCKPPARLAMLVYADFTRPDTWDAEYARLRRQLERRGEAPSSRPDDLSPFVAGPPITAPRQFFGRERELKRLFNLVRRKPLQNAAIVAPRRAGKTSLLFHLKSLSATPSDALRLGQRRDWLDRAESYRWVFVDFQDPRMRTRQGLLRYLAGALGLPAGCEDLDRFIEAAARAVRSPTVMLLDEVDVALQRQTEFDSSFWEALRSLASNQTGGNLAFVLACREHPHLAAETNNVGSPFFNIFGYTAHLGPFAEPEAHQLIGSSPIPFDKSDVDWIVRSSAGWPILLQILCRERLMSLDEAREGDDWKHAALDQLQPFSHLLTGRPAAAP